MNDYGSFKMIYSYADINLIYQIKHLLVENRWNGRIGLGLVRLTHGLADLQMV